MLPCGRVLHHFDRRIWICLGGGQTWLFMCQSHMEDPAVVPTTAGRWRSLLGGGAEVGAGWPTWSPCHFLTKWPLLRCRLRLHKTAIAPLYWPVVISAFPKIQPSFNTNQRNTDLKFALVTKTGLLHLTCHTTSSTHLPGSNFGRMTSLNKECTCLWLIPEWWRTTPFFVSAKYTYGDRGIIKGRIHFCSLLLL